MIDEYKEQTNSGSELSSKIERDLALNDQIASTGSLMDFFSQNSCDIINKFISSAISEFHEENFDKFYEQIVLIISFLNELSESSFDINSILPNIFNSDLHDCLINSINLGQQHVQIINEVLSLISILSPYPKNYEFFEKSSILEISLNLMKLNDEVLFQQCIVIVNKYIGSHEKLETPISPIFLIRIIKKVSKNVLFSDHCIDMLNNIILYLDALHFITEILNIMNFILIKTNSIYTYEKILASIKIIFDVDPLNFHLIFQSRMIHIFTEKLNSKFLKDEKYYQSTIEKYFDFINHSFETIDFKWQEIIIKLIGIDTFIEIFKKIQNYKILFSIHLILLKYTNSHESFEDILPFVAYFTEIEIIGDLLNEFENQTFKVKKLILDVFLKLVKTHSYAFFEQSLKNERLNYLEICAEFVIDSESHEIKRTFLESILCLLQIAEQNDEKYLISGFEFINDFVSDCLECDDQIVQVFARNYFEMTCEGE